MTASRHDPNFNLDYVSYQQYAAPLGTLVDGGQVTVVSRDGKQLLVGGAYYPGLRSPRTIGLSAAQALQVAADVRGGLTSLPDGIRQFATRRTSMRLDPAAGRLFYLVATAAPANNGYQQIDAQTGDLLGAWGGVDQIDPGQGIGVKGDTKTLSPSPFAAAAAALTSKPGSDHLLQSTGTRFVTYNANGGNTLPPNANSLMSDANFNDDNKWKAASQAAGVDAQYYAALTVQFYEQELGYDWLNDCAVDSQQGGPHGTYGWPNQVRSVVHFDDSPNSFPFDNAFWDELRFYMVYGDGSTADRPLSAGQDVVSHELSHAVTQCTGNLKYRSESGALNESFSDIMATAAEFIVEEPLNSNCRLRPGQTECADWLIGEDVARTTSGAAIRDLADPGAKGQPSHYADRSFQGWLPNQCNSGDNCGVHHNSGIPNHAFYLLAHGGRNARCSGPTDARADCDVVVPPTSLDHATKIWFSGLTTLTGDATMCDARNSTIAAASVLYPGSTTDIAATILAWQAVGLNDATCDLAANAHFDISLSDPIVELQPGDAGATQLSILRHTDNSDISYAVQTTGPATVVANPPVNSGSAGTQISVTADNNATDGVYPILVTATGTSGSQYAAAAFVVDTAGPVAAVTNVRFDATTVSTSGDVDLTITWSASDSASGVANAQLNHSPNGSGWTYVGPGSPIQYPVTAGPHQFQVWAIDAAGNETTSAPFIRTLNEYQETAATLTYPASWKFSNAGTPWGTTRYSGKRGATATLTFSGTSVAWIGQRGPKRGVANVFVDGVKTHVDLYSPTTLSECRVVFIASGLSAGQHTIKIKVKGTSGRPRVDVDGFFVLS